MTEPSSLTPARSPLERLEPALFDHIINLSVAEVDRRKDWSKFDAYLQAKAQHYMMQERLGRYGGVEFNRKIGVDPKLQPAYDAYDRQLRDDTSSILPLLALMLSSKSLYQRIWLDTDEVYWKRLLWTCGLSRPAKYDAIGWKELAREFWRHQNQECVGRLCRINGQRGPAGWCEIDARERVPARLDGAVQLLGDLKPVYPRMDTRVLRCMKESEARKWAFPTIDGLSAHTPDCLPLHSRPLHLAPLLTPVPLHKVKVHVTFMRALRPVLGNARHSFLVENHAGVTTVDLEDAFRKYVNGALKQLYEQHMDQLEVLDQFLYMEEGDIQDVFYIKGTNSAPMRLSYPLRVVSGGKLVIELYCPLYNQSDESTGWAGWFDNTGYGSEEEDASDEDEL